MGCCSAPNCCNKTSAGYRLFRFPSDICRRAIWLQNCRDNWNPTSGVIIGIQHLPQGFVRMEGCAIGRTEGRILLNNVGSEHTLAGGRMWEFKGCNSIFLLLKVVHWNRVPRAGFVVDYPPAEITTQEHSICISGVPFYQMAAPEKLAQATLMKDVILNANHPTELLLQKHADYIATYGTNKDEYEYCMTEYLRMSGIYWGLTAIELMGNLDRMNKEEILEFIRMCQDESGGISASVGHDPHLLYTLSAVQILSMYDAMNNIDVERVVEYVKGLQQADGSFCGDKWGEVDTRFSFCAVACLSLVGRLEAIDVKKAVEFVLSCMNFDGGFGSRPGSESHAGLIYCCLGMLSITGDLHCVDADLLGWWLCERQLPSGGLNGRPEKLPDVCYSWWVLASLSILGRLHWIHRDALIKFVLACQDTETGGFSDRPGDLPDPFHTLFGLAALSLLGDSSVKPVNPTYCMPQHVIDRLGLRPQKLCV